MSAPAATQNPVELLIDDLSRPGNLFAIDIENMTPEMLSACPGGKARCAYDLIFEVTEFNNFVAKRASGQEATLDNDGWAVAPQEFRSKETALGEFKASISALTSALRSASESSLSTPVDTPFGELPIIALAKIAPRHIMYHSGQLNYIQTIYGDDVFHWA